MLSRWVRMLRVWYWQHIYEALYWRYGLRLPAPHAKERVGVHDVFYDASYWVHKVQRENKEEYITKHFRDELSGYTAVVTVSMWHNEHK